MDGRNEEVPPPRMFLFPLSYPWVRSFFFGSVWEAGKRVAPLCQQGAAKLYGGVLAGDKIIAIYLEKPSRIAVGMRPDK